MAAATTITPTRPRALVYRGPATRGDGDLSLSVARLLESSPRNFTTAFVGPSEPLQPTADTLQQYDLFAYPGGPDLDEAYAEIKPYEKALQDFVAKGGRYLGFCLGAYLAGYSPGLRLLPKGADTDAECDQKGAQVKTDEDAVIQVDWTWSFGEKAGKTEDGQWIFFQEGAVMKGFKQGEDSFVLARYSKSGRVAASLNKYGEGWVGCCGPHPEATRDWFERYALPCPHGIRYDIGHDLIEATMNGTAAVAPEKEEVVKKRNPLSKLFGKK